MLTAKNCNSAWLQDFATRMENSCMDKLLQYEGGQKSKSYPKGTYLGIGNRVYNYKKNSREKMEAKIRKMRSCKTYLLKQLRLWLKLKWA